MVDETFLHQARCQASKWARNLLARNPDTWVILDKETTGLDPKAEVIQIGVIDGRGDVLMNNVLVKPTRSIPPEATAVHHITNDMVKDALSFPDVLPQLLEVIEGKLLVIYNANYDIRLLIQSARAHNIGVRLGIEARTCAMLKYAEWFGDWNEEYQSFRWQKLQGGDHSALGDCHATLAAIRRMAEVAI